MRSITAVLSPLSRAASRSVWRCPELLSRLSIGPTVLTASSPLSLACLISASVCPRARRRATTRTCAAAAASRRRDSRARAPCAPIAAPSPARHPRALRPAQASARRAAHGALPRGRADRAGARALVARRASDLEGGARPCGQSRVAAMTDPDRRAHPETRCTCARPRSSPSACCCRATQGARWRSPRRCSRPAHVQPQSRAVGLHRRGERWAADHDPVHRHGRPVCGDRAERADRARRPARDQGRAPAGRSRRS